MDVDIKSTSFNFAKYLKKEFEDKFDFDISSFHGVEINPGQYVDYCLKKALLSFKLLEKVATYLLFCNECVILDEEFNIKSIIPKGLNAFETQRLSSETQIDYLKESPITLLNRSAPYLYIDGSIISFFNFLRNGRNRLVHTVQGDIDGVKNITTFFETFYIVLFWLVSIYLNNYIDYENRPLIEELSKKIFRSKLKLQLISDRVVYPNKEPIKDDYVSLLENRVRELETEVDYYKKEMDSNLKTLLKMVGEVKDNTESIKQAQESIAQKLDDLTAFVLDSQKAIEEKLELASHRNDKEMVEKIVADFTNQITDKIISEIHDKSKDYYEEEKGQLKALFGDELWNKLDGNSKNFLITGKVLYRELNKMHKVDYSGVCLLITKAVENELNKHLYVNFRRYLEKKYPYPEKKDAWPSFFLKTNLYGEFIIYKEEFSLGSVKYFCCQNNGFNQNDKDVLLDYSQNVLFKDGLSKEKIEDNLSFISESAEKIRVDFRNPSAHVSKIDITKANDCLSYIIDTTKVLIKYMSLFR